MSSLTWSYGITTVPLRLKSGLTLNTINSIKSSGFTRPRLFIDGLGEKEWMELSVYKQYHHLSATLRFPNIGITGNWMLSLLELYTRTPKADRFLLFQDDIICSRNLKKYLESCYFPPRGYLNLYTFPENEKDTTGWYLSNQLGRGAVALCFDNKGLKSLFNSKFFINKLNHSKGTTGVDGAIILGMKEQGYSEYVHNPSLVNHVNSVSTVNHFFEPCECFAGEDFDLMSLKPKTVYHQISSSNKIGLVGYWCDTGLGELNRQILNYVEIDKFLIKQHRHKPTKRSVPDQVDVTVCKNDDPDKIRKFVKSVDTILFCETPYFQTLVEIARQEHKRIICVPMQEWLPPFSRYWVRNVDLFISPTLQCHNRIKEHLPSKYFPWPFDIEEFQFKQRKVVNNFLFINGHGGWENRKGIDVINEALSIWPEFPLYFSSQKPLSVKGKNVINIPPQTFSKSLYSYGDVLLNPHKVDGLGLERMEAMSSGMPVISTNGEPWIETPCISYIPSEISKKWIGNQDVDWYEPSAEHLVEICKEIHGSFIDKESLDVRDYAEAHSWNKLKDEFNTLIKTGVQKVTL